MQVCAAVFLADTAENGAGYAVELGRTQLFTEMLERARRKGPDVEWVQGDLLALRAAGLSPGHPALGRAVDVPDIDLYAIDVSFAAHPDAAEATFLNGLPTRFEVGEGPVILNAAQIDIDPVTGRDRKSVV